MQKEYSTKDMQPKETSTKYFFSGEGVYYPLTVEAKNIQEAKKKYDKQKKLISNK